MTSRPLRLLAGFVLMAFVAAGCTSESAGGEQPAADGPSEACQLATESVLERFDEFLAPYSDLSPDEFLAEPELDGLDDFQEDVAQIVVDRAIDPNDDCNEGDLQSSVEDALASYSGQSLLGQYLVGSVLSGGIVVESRDVVVAPDDDLTAILPLLGSGSSVTFGEGTYELAGTVLVQTELTLVGAGLDKTILKSSADAAAIAVLGQGNLTMQDLAVQHTGDLPASVILDFDAPLTLIRTSVSGAIADDQGEGGSGLVVTNIAEGSAAADAPPSDAVVVISDSVFSDNDAAGIAITSNLAPVITGVQVDNNTQCGVCFFDGATGSVTSSVLEGNGVGLQASGTAAPQVFNNRFVNNLVAGVLIEDASTVEVFDNEFVGDGIVGIDVQGTAAPTIAANSFGPHAVALSLRGDSTAAVQSNLVDGGDVGLLVGGAADPTVSDNEISESAITAMLHTETSTGMFISNVVTDTIGAGVVVEGRASPTHTGAHVAGGVVGVVFREDATGTVSGSTIEGQEVGVEAGDQSMVTLEENRFVGQTAAGIIFSSEGTGVLKGNTFTEQVAIGIQTGGSGSPTIEGNTVVGGDTGALITESSTAEYVSNSFSDQNFGIGVSGEAMPTIRDNEIERAVAGALSFEDSSGGSVSGNVIIDAGLVGIRIAGTATPELQTNRLFALLPVDESAPPAEGDDAPDDDASDDDAAGDVEPAPAPDGQRSGAGLLYAENAAGIAGLNEIFGFVIGVQVSDDAAPELSSNRVDGARIGGVGFLYGSNAAGIASGNVAANQQLGFQVGDSASPTLEGNIVDRAQSAAILLQGEAAAVLDANECNDSAAGIVVLEAANPDIGSNDCSVLRP